LSPPPSRLSHLSRILSSSTNELTHFSSSILNSNPASTGQLGNAASNIGASKSLCRASDTITASAFATWLNALARETPEPYLDALARVVEEMNDPLNWRGGQISAMTTWKILIKYLQRLSPEVLNSGSVDRYLDAIEKYGTSSSSEPRDVYAFCILRVMNDRAKRFRERANRAASYDLDYYFKQVDQNPSHKSL